MNLYDVYRNNSFIPFDAINKDIELAQHIQIILVAHKLLSPPADGRFGIISKSALSNFQSRVGNSSTGLDKPLAELLIETKPNVVRANNTTVETVKSSSNKPVDVIIDYCKSKDYKLFTRENEVNIIYLEGCNTDFTLNDDRPNLFNDLRLLIEFVDNEPVILGKWKATTEPGRKYTERPLNPNGAFRIAFGQHLNAWQVGTHKAGTSGAHEALVQIAPVTGYRDRNRDYQRTGDLLVTGLFGINQHWGYDMQFVEGASAGCLCGQTRDGHRQFMRLIKNDANYISNRAYRFSTIILDGSKVFR